MKYEPLKGKICRLVDAPWDVDEEERAFDFRDVKSAVQGLLEEIDKLPTETIYDKIAETRDGMAIAPFEFIKKMSVIDLIKKWFPDVVEGEE